MRKLSAKTVEITGKLLGKVRMLSTMLFNTTWHGDKTIDLYARLQQVIPATFHDQIRIILSVKREFVPIIHSTYKDNQNRKINYIVTSRSIT